MINSLKAFATLGLVVMLGGGPAFGEPAAAVAGSERTSLTKAKIYLVAGDYRRALEACQREIDNAPSVEAYIHLTYVFHAIDAYLDHLSREERWNTVEQLYLNLAYKDPQDLVDPPGGLARMAKEMIQTSVHQQSDVSAAMATRLDKSEADRLWQQQTQWRTANPQTWWTGIPDAWR
ncbi:MAG: hypothetical protein ABI980_11260 [Nitrospirota bacterium]